MKWVIVRVTDLQRTAEEVITQREMESEKKADSGKAMICLWKEKMRGGGSKKFALRTFPQVSRGRAE